MIQPSLCWVLAQQGGQEPATFFDTVMSMAPFIVIIVVFFWWMSRSQKKKDQQREQALDTIRPKDRVMTIGGIHGKVVSVRDDVFVLRVDDEKDVKISISRNGISRKVETGSEG